MTCDRLPCWVGPENAGLFTCIHIPKNNNINSVGVVLCNALGHEYTHAHRSVRFLADQLAHNGYPSVRFDYYASGDSTGDPSSPLSVSTWLENLDAEINNLKKTTGVSSVCLIGIRIGATLAAVYAESHAIDFMVLWNPCVSGQRYIREMQALSIITSNKLMTTDNEQSQGIESAGFVMHTDTAAEIQQINLKKLNFQNTYTQCKKILLIERDDVVVNNKYYETLKKHGLSVEQIRTPGYSDMMAEPQDTIIPKHTISQINSWLNNQSNNTTLETQNIALNSDIQCTTFKWNDSQIKETICTLGKNKLLGILSEPAYAPNKHKPLIVLSNSGSAHHVGPNRLYVELARTMAVAGFSCLRYDLANLGDSISCESIHDSVNHENHPYPSHAVEDISCVIQTMQSRYDYKQFILAGLCSGSHTSFHAGLELDEPNIPECILINPLTFYWKEGMSLDIPNAYETIKNAKYYQYAIKDYNKWLKLFSGQAQTKLIVQFFFKFIYERISNIFQKIFEAFNLKKKSNLSKDLSRFKEKNRHLSFFFSTTDPGYNILLSEAKKTMLTLVKSGHTNIEFIEEADHTFSKRKSRQIFINKFKAHIENRYQEKNE